MGINHRPFTGILFQILISDVGVLSSVSDWESRSVKNLYVCEVAVWKVEAKNSSA